MSSETFLRLNIKGDYACWIRLGPQRELVTSGEGPLADVAESINSDCVVIVPGEDVLLTRADVPGHNKRVLRQAIPYALEEFLADDVDSLHFALGHRSGSNINVAVVNQKRMAHWLECLEDAGISASALVPDTLLLPLPDNQWQLACFDNRCLLRTGPQAGLVMDQENYPVILKAVLAEAGNVEPDAISLYSHEECEFEQIELDVPLEQCAVAEPSLHWLARHYDEKQSINLLQGPYSRSERIGQYWRPWRLVASLALVWLVAQFAIGIVDYQRYSGERLALKQEIENIYRKTFPDAKKVVNAKVQMERRLKALRGGNGGDASGKSFNAMLALAGTHFKDVKSLELRRVSYKEGQLDVSLNLGDFQQLDSLKQKLTEGGRLQVEIQSASAKGKGVEARLRIMEQSS